MMAALQSRQRITAAIEADARKSQLRLPFPDEQTIDMARACSILHVSPWVVRRLSVTRLHLGTDDLCIVAYNTMRSAPLRIDYDSLVRFLDHLRVKHGIADRRPPRIFSRYRDDDLLPFPWADTMMVNEAAQLLGIAGYHVRVRIESGLFEAYQLVPTSDWRISRSSFQKYLDTTTRLPRRERPYGG